MQVSNSRVLIFPTLNDPTTSSKTILALKNSHQVLPLSGSINPTDPNSTYAATRILFKEFFSREFKDSLEAIAEQGSNSWMDETFRHWLIKFVDADFYDIPEERTYIYIVPVDNDIQNLNNSHIAKLSEEDLKTHCPEEYKEYTRARDYYQEAEQTGTIQYYGVLNCEQSEPWRNHYEALYSGILREKGDRWLNYTAVDSRLPTESELAKLRGLVVSGANHAAYDDAPFHEALYKVLQKAFHEYPQLKLLGVCFGHQVLAHCLGGKAEKMQGLNVPFMTNLDLVQAKPELKQKSYYKKTLEKLGIADVDKFVAVEAHGDHVAALPAKAEILGNSETTNVEMWGLEEKVFCTQFHPEFNEGLMKLKLLQEITYEEAVNAKMMNRFLDSEKNLTLDRTFQITLCKNFIKN